MNRTVYLTAIALRNEAEDACRAEHAAAPYWARIADQADRVGNYVDANRYRKLARDSRYAATSWAALTNLIALQLLLRDGKAPVLS